MSQKIIFAIVSIFFVLVSCTSAQNGRGICNDAALNLAQDAFDADNREEAWQLAARAEALCVNDAERFNTAQRLRLRTEIGLSRTDFLSQPGIVTVGEYDLYLVCMGEGSPTVIFEDMLDGSQNSWHDIQPAVSSTTRTCRYDRLGSARGQSDDVAPGTVRTTQDQVDDLLALLEIAEIDPPYIFVGDGIGGFNVLLFTAQNPDSVTGIVLIEAEHPDWYEQVAAAYPSTVSPVPNEGRGGERLDIASSIIQVSEIDSFGDRPLVVVTAGDRQYISEAVRDAWLELQETYTTYSSNSQRIIDENSDLVMNIQPQLIIGAILRVLDESVSN